MNITISINNINGRKGNNRFRDIENIDSRVKFGIDKELGIYSVNIK